LKNSNNLLYNFVDVINKKNHKNNCEKSHENNKKNKKITNKKIEIIKKSRAQFSKYFTGPRSFVIIVWIPY